VLVERIHNDGKELAAESSGLSPDRTTVGIWEILGSLCYMFTSFAFPLTRHYSIADDPLILFVLSPLPRHVRLSC